MSNESYMWFSPATDITGNNLKDALAISGGKTKPTSAAKTVIGWGTKTKEDVSFPAGTVVLNHPNAIRKNRNKFESILTMAEALNVGGATHIAKVVSAEQVLANLSSGAIKLPLIGRRKYHQGGKGFWPCPTIVQVKEALALPDKERAQYFQEMIPVKTEYRLHVFNGEVIHAVKKVKRSAAEFEAAFIEDELARQKKLWEKNNQGSFNEDQAKEMIRRQAKNATAGGPNSLLRSNRMGWKFAIVTKYSKDMAKVAIDAVNALGLDFGAVDTCITEDGTPYVFEINTGPGLEATSFDKYVEAFKKVLAPGAATKTTTTVAPTAPTTPATGTSDRRKYMLDQVDRYKEMLETAADDELETIARVGNTLIFGRSE